MAGEINVGDAVLTFIADTTNIDETFQSLPGKVRAGTAPIRTELDGVSGGLKRVAADADESLGKEVPAAAELTRKEMREARGEVRLLGEEFGIRLPRHVANFVAEMPGVGEALSAAFSATAVLFLIKALVEATEKVADFAAAMFIYTEAEKAAHAALVAHEQELGKQSDAYIKAKKAVDDYGKSQLELASDKINSTNTSIKEQNDIIYDNTQRVGAATLGITKYSEAEVQSFKDAIELAKAKKKALEEVQELQNKQASDIANEVALKSLKEEISLREKLTHVQITYLEAVKGLSGEDADELRYQASLKALKAKSAAEAKYGKDSVDLVKTINTEIEGLETQHALKMQQEADKVAKELEKTFAGMQKDIGQNTVGALQAVTVALNPVIQHMLKLRTEAQALGVTLRVDLETKLQEAKKALLDYQASTITNTAQTAAFKRAVHDAASALKLFDQEAKGGKRSIDAMKTSMQEFKDTSSAAVMELGTGVSKAFEGMLTHQQSFGKAMEKATFEMLASMAEKWGAFYLAKGIADIWLDPAASAEELAGGLALEALGGVLSGLGPRGGSGSTGSSNTQTQSSSSNTGGSQRGTIGITGVQHFADGGLVSAPTLAVIGETGQREAVLPLENAEAMARIGKAIAASGGGSVHHHLNVHVKGMVSPDNLTKVVGQINDRVNRGRMNLKASNTFKITKRGG